MSVAAELAVRAAMFEAEITEACGPKGKHDAKRAAVRHGSGRGSVTLGGRRVAVGRPRARTLDGHEVPLTSYRAFRRRRHARPVVIEQMSPGSLADARITEPVAGVNQRRNPAARRFRVGSCARPRPRWPS